MNSYSVLHPPQQRASVIVIRIRHKLPQCSRGICSGIYFTLSRHTCSGPVLCRGSDGAVALRHRYAYRHRIAGIAQKHRLPYLAAYIDSKLAFGIHLHTCCKRDRQDYLNIDLKLAMRHSINGKRWCRGGSCDVRKPFQCYAVYP